MPAPGNVWRLLPESTDNEHSAELSDVRRDVPQGLAGHNQHKPKQQRHSISGVLHRHGVPVIRPVVPERDPYNLALI
jgi:hypothetical protein